MNVREREHASRDEGCERHGATGRLITGTECSTMLIRERERGELRLTLTETRDKTRWCLSSTCRRAGREKRTHVARCRVSCTGARVVRGAEPRGGGFEVAEIRSDPVHTCSNKSYATGILIVPDVGAGRASAPGWSTWVPIPVVEAVQCNNMPRAFIHSCFLLFLLFLRRHKRPRPPRFQPPSTYIHGLHGREAASPPGGFCDDRP